MSYEVVISARHYERGTIETGRGPVASRYAGLRWLASIRTGLRRDGIEAVGASGERMAYVVWIDGDGQRHAAELLPTGTVAR